MQVLTVLKGLQASGKSTHAKELVAKGWKRVNKDDLRAMIDSSYHSKHNEKEIREVELKVVETYLSKGHSVVVDSTNFNYVEYWKDVAKKHNVAFEVITFDTPLMECIERDAKRGDKSVGAKVIQETWERHLKPKQEWLDSLPLCYIFDIDGTLAKMNGRSPYDYTKVDTDVVNNQVAMILHLINSHSLGDKIRVIIMSGRDSGCRDKTLNWLVKNGIVHDALYMRAEGDNRKDSIIKKELYEEHIKGKYNVLGVFDDRNQVVDMWRSLGLTCFQVAYGYF